MRFHALSVVAPAGDRIRGGRKTLEIRTWAPEIWPLRDLLIVQNRRRLSRSSGPTEDPDGAAVALVDVARVRVWREEDLPASCGERWAPGYLAWELENIRPVNYPQPLPARLRLYALDLDGVDGALLDGLGRAAARRLNL